MTDRNGDLAVWHIIPGGALGDVAVRGGGDWDYGPGPLPSARWAGIDGPARPRGRAVRDKDKAAAKRRAPRPRGAAGAGTSGAT